jgi:phosphoadenosine phosphosulfate reductase
MTYTKRIDESESAKSVDKNSAIRLFQSIDQNDPIAVLKLALKHFGSQIALASSFSIEDVALIDMMVKIDPHARILALDTGRLNEETYECAEQIRDKYDCNIEWFFPDRDAVEQLITDKGLFSFKESTGNRQECCFVRKVLPLKRALTGLQAWVTGQRRQQSSTRVNVQVVEVDEANGGIVKLNPLSFWSSDQVKEYVDRHQIPYNRLYDLGYQSIGCGPCTRATAPGEDERAGRWWWEDAAHKECGIHLVSPKHL